MHKDQQAVLVVGTVKEALDACSAVAILVLELELGLLRARAAEMGPDAGTGIDHGAGGHIDVVGEHLVGLSSGDRDGRGERGVCGREVERSAPRSRQRQQREGERGRRKERSHLLHACCVGGVRVG